VNSKVLRGWNGLMRPYGLSRERCLESYQHIIHAAYTEPHRRYHTDEHLADCLDVIDRFIPYVPNLDAIVLAIFFHDIVYDPQKTNNEAASVSRFESLYRRLQIPKDTALKVTPAIYATRHDGEPHDAISKAVVDVDLSVLALPTEEYDERYAWKIREEYSFVPDKAFKEGRAKILTGLLARPDVYHTEIFREAFEKKARENLHREIAILRRET
jgi:predicted metal-dependent HD superfamily phosphohydrolase